MEQEVFLSGYCRCLDANRIVTMEEDGGQWEIDCDFKNCPYTPVCQIARQIQAHMEE